MFTFETPPKKPKNRLVPPITEIVKFYPLEAEKFRFSFR